MGDSMSTIINATTTNGVVIQPDNSGSLVLQTNNGTTAVTIDTSQNLQFNSGYGSVATAYGCRAWVNFNGTGTVAIRASGNVSSITDNGTGDYTVNFITAMPDINYIGTLTASGISDSFCTKINTNNATGTEVAPSTTAMRVMTNAGYGLGGRDEKYINFVAFR
jgi:hypothetical protein